MRSRQTCRLVQGLLLQGAARSRVANRCRSKPTDKTSVSTSNIMHATEPTRRDHAPLQCFEAWTGKFKVSDHNMSSRAAFLLAALAVLATTALAANRRMLIEGGTWVKNSEGEDIYVNPPQSADTCTNVAPDQRYTCDQQKEFGACDKDFVKDGNYCLFTCGRCPSEDQGGDSQDSGSDGQDEAEMPSEDGDDDGSFNEPGNSTVCDDVAPDAEFTCEQQRDFGKCREWYIVDNQFCARTCGLPPCPAVPNLPERNGTSTSISRRRPRNGTTTAGIPSTTATAPLDFANTTLPTPILTPVVPGLINTVPPIADALPNNITNTTEPLAGANTTEVVPPLEPTVVPAADLPVDTPTVPPTEPVTVVPAVVTTAPLPSPAITEPAITEPAITEPVASPAADAAVVTPNVTEPVASPAIDAAAVAPNVSEPIASPATDAAAVAPNVTEPVANATVLPVEVNVTDATVAEVAPVASPAVAAP